MNEAVMGEKVIEEYKAVKEEVGILDFSMEGKVKITGGGRASFIDGVVSNDVKNVEENGGVYAAFLDKNGKVLSDCVAYKLKDCILLNMPFPGKQNVLGKLREEAKLAKSEVEDVTMKYGLLSLQGPKSLETIGGIFGSVELKKQYSCAEVEKSGIKVIIAKNSRTAEEGYDIFVPANSYKQLKELMIKRGIREVSNKTYNTLRLEAGIPLFTIDFDDKNILPEVSQKAISYGKGCYVGQEIIVKVKNLAGGKTAKKLVLLELDSKDVPEKGAAIAKDNNEIGKITSAAYSFEKEKAIALGMVKKGFYEEGNKVEVNGSKAAILQRA